MSGYALRKQENRSAATNQENRPDRGYLVRIWCCYGLIIPIGMKCSLKEF